MRPGGASRSLAELATHGRPGRREPELWPSTVFRTAYPSSTSDASAADAGLLDMVSNIRREPRLFDPVPGETRPSSASGRSGLAERPRVNSFFNLLAVGLVGASIVGVFFGIAFSLLPQPEEKTVVAAGPGLRGAEQSVSTAKGSTDPGDPPAKIIASPGNARGPDPRSHALDSPTPAPQAGSSPGNEPTPNAPAPQASSSPANEPTPNAGASNQSLGHLPTRRERSAHHHPHPLANAEKQRILSAAIDRAHRENFSDPFQSLTPPRAGARNSFDQLITYLSEQAQPVQPLTPPQPGTTDSFDQLITRLTAQAKPVRSLTPP
jgi:hypothetical protein